MMRVRLGLAVILILSAMPLAFGLTINPEEYKIQQIEFDRSYQITATIINSESGIYDMQLVLDKNSDYLAEYVTIEDQAFQLTPNEKKNIRLVVKVPQDALSPEEHLAQVNIMSAGTKLGDFKIRFSIPGEKTEKLLLEHLAAADTPRDEPLYILLSLSNPGNVIARATPVVEIYEGSKFIERFGEQSQIMVMPDSDMNLTLMYDLSKLDYKRYKAKASLIYNNNQNTNTLEQEFSVMPKTEKDIQTEEINQGDRLIFTLILENPAEQLTFFNCSYSIDNTGISGSAEGEFSETRKELQLDIDTSELEPASYLLHVETRTGKQLESLEEENIQIIVNPQKNTQYIIGLLIFIVAVIIFYFAKPLLMRAPREFRKIDALEARLKSVSTDFDTMEHNFRSLADDVSSFINDSNQWLDSAFGRGRYGFK